jgi:hypothetical protein
LEGIVIITNNMEKIYFNKMCELCNYKRNFTDKFVRNTLVDRAQLKNHHYETK